MGNSFLCHIYGTKSETYSLFNGNIEKGNEFPSEIK